MAISISLLARNASGNAIVTLIDNGSANPNGFMEIRTGSKPATPQDSATGTLLATLSFSNPAFGSFSGGAATANAISPDTSVDATGLASWFRIYNRDSQAVLDGTITATGGGGDLEFDNVNFIESGTVQITSMTIAMPNAC